MTKFSCCSWNYILEQPGKKITAGRTIYESQLEFSSSVAKYFKRKEIVKMNLDPTIEVEEDIKLKLESIKEEKIDSPEIKAEPLDIKEEPLDIKEEPLEATKPENVRKRKDCDKNGKHSNWKSFKSSKEMYGIHSEETTISAVHEKKKRYKCSVCDGLFDSKFQLKKHSFNVHEMKKPHECSICGKAFYQKDSLKSHSANVHEGKKAPMSKKKKSNKKKKKKHLNVENVAEVSAEKSGEKRNIRNQTFLLSKFSRFSRDPP